MSNREGERAKELGLPASLVKLVVSPGKICYGGGLMRIDLNDDTAGIALFDFTI